MLTEQRKSKQSGCNRWIPKSGGVDEKKRRQGGRYGECSGNKAMCCPPLRGLSYLRPSTKYVLIMRAQRESNACDEVGIISCYKKISEGRVGDA